MVPETPPPSSPLQTRLAQWVDRRTGRRAEFVQLRDYVQLLRVIEMVVGQWWQRRTLKTGLQLLLGMLILIALSVLGWWWREAHYQAQLVQARDQLNGHIALKTQAIQELMQNAKKAETANSFSFSKDDLAEALIRSGASIEAWHKTVQGAAIEHDLTLLVPPTQLSALLKTLSTTTLLEFDLTPQETTVRVHARLHES